MPRLTTVLPNVAPGQGQGNRGRTEGLTPNIHDRSFLFKLPVERGAYLEVEPLLDDDPDAPGLSVSGLSALEEPLDEPLVVPDEDESDAPGFPAAPLLDEELPVLEGLEAEPEVEPGEGLEVESVAVLAGLSAPVCEGLVVSCPVSQPANANAITAEAMALLVQMFMIVFLWLMSEPFRSPGPIPQTLCQLVCGRRWPIDQVALRFVSGMCDSEFR
ncbi:MAG: hypothetical protein ACREV9_15280 [Burkholderiales bacterium]